jgi:hypothetical protein
MTSRIKQVNAKDGLINVRMQCLCDSLEQAGHCSLCVRGPQRPRQDHQHALGQQADTNISFHRCFKPLADSTVATDTYQ